MPAHARLTSVVIASVALLAAGGCGGEKLYPVKGKITFEGKPLQGGGSIAFMPTSKQDGKAPGGEIAEDGTYTLMTKKPGDGSMTGEFRVVINQTTEREPESTRDGEKSGKSISIVAKGDRIPAIYSDAYNSPLRAKVEAKENVIDFELKRDAGGFGPIMQGAMLGEDPRRDLFARKPRNHFLVDPFGPSDRGSELAPE